MTHRILAFAASTRGIGYVLLIDGELKDWRLSKKARQSSILAGQWTGRIIERLQPGMVVTEVRGNNSRKGVETRAAIEAIALVAEQAGLHHISVRHEHGYANKYEEAEALAEQFPQIGSWLPKRPRIWQSEPANMIYFEALSMALSVIGMPEEF